MSRLTVKLLCLFSASIVFTAILILISINFFTTRQFKNFIIDSDVIISRDYSILLSKYYEINNYTWENVDVFVHSFWKDSDQRMDWEILKRDQLNDIMAEAAVNSNDISHRLVLLDMEGRVIADTLDVITGEFHPVDHWEKGVAVQLDGNTIGTVLYGSMIDPVLNPLDREFLESVNWAVFISAMIVVFITIIIGYFFVRSFIAPLNKLSEAMERVTEGELDIEISVNTKDEVQKLAENFNKMSRRLYRAREWRDKVTADISHEIRTPVTTIQGELEAMLDGVYPLDLSVIETVYRDTLTLTKIVEDLQLLDSLEFDKTSLDLEEVDLIELIHNTIKSFNSASKEKGICIVTDTPKSVPKLNLDYRKLRQVLNNLITNSLRYSPGGRNIIIGIKKSKEDLILYVKDFGSGIEESDLPHVFDRFFRADPSRSRKSGGFGLGLSISKSIIEAHNGQIRAQSVPGEGTTISCFFRLQ